MDASNARLFLAPPDSVWRHVLPLNQRHGRHRREVQSPFGLSEACTLRQALRPLHLRRLTPARAVSRTAEALRHDTEGRPGRIYGRPLPARVRIDCHLGRVQASVGSHVGREDKVVPAAPELHGREVDLVLLLTSNGFPTPQLAHDLLCGSAYPSNQIS